MRYLKLFEAFESETISKITKFLKSKNINSGDFVNSLRKIMINYDIQIDKIKESDVQYLNRKSALKLKGDSENKFNIKYLKFWFSLEEGYLGYTGTGDITYSFEEWESRYSGESNRNSKFNKDELEYIVNTLGIEKGLLVPVTDYTKIKTGDKLIGILDGDRYSIDKLTLSTAWVDDQYNDFWCIQNVAYGGEPRSLRQMVDGEELRWDRFGRTHWSMGSLNSPSDDHHKLHFYIKSDEPLHYEHEEKELKTDENPLDYNLPIVRKEIKNWSGAGYSINRYEDVENSDFSIIIDLDNVLKYSSSPSIMKKQRTESREGATKLMTDDQIRDLNIQRYVSQLLSTMDIKVDTTSVKNLQKIMMKYTCDKYTLIQLTKNSPTIDYISRFIGNIKSLIKTEGVQDKEYYLTRMNEDFQNIQLIRLENIRNNKISSDYLESIHDQYPNIKPVLEKIYEISSFINKYFENTNINTVEDLKINYHLINSIRSIFSDTEFRLSGYMLRVIENFRYKSDVDYYIRNYTYSDEEKKSDLEKLSHVEKFIKKIMS